MAKHRLHLALALVALCAAAPVHLDDGEHLKVDRMGADSLRLTITTHETTDPAVLQAWLTTKFTEFCGGRAGRLVKFSFEATAPLSGASARGLRLVQGIECGAVAAQTATVAATAWRAGPSDDIAARAAFDTFWTRGNEAGIARADAMRSTGQRADQPSPRWIESARERQRAAGAARGATATKITWDYDPPAQEPGAYVSVDFRRETEGYAIDCGYTSFRRTSDGRFEVVHEEEGSLTRAMAKTMSANVLAAVPQSLQCRV